MLTRRFFLKDGGIAVAGLGLLPSFLARAAATNRRRRKNKILISIFQRGAADGLNMVVPFAERTYYNLRPSIAIPPPRRGSSQSGNGEASMDLDGFFALHPALAPFYRLYQQGHLAIVNAAGSPHNTRSHFDAQDFMETATLGAKSTTDGWLNRHLSSQSEADATPFRAVALGSSLPRTLQGRAPALAMSSIREFRVLAGEERFRTLYDGDDSDFLYGTGQEMLGAIEFLRHANPEQYRPAPGIEYPRSRFGQSLRQIAQLIKAGIGLELAFADLGGWDTHARQGSLNGQLPNRLADFGRGIAALYADLGDRMEDVVILTMSEFGRTVAENGNRGTDHGHANAMFVMGGIVRGGRVHGKWPGLAREQLYEGRDLALSTDFRDVFAELIASHLGNQNLNAVFPGFNEQPANFPGLLKA